MLCVTMCSTISCSACRLTSFHFMSESGSRAKSKRTQHCCSFARKSSSRSAGGASLIAGSLVSSRLALTLKVREPVLLLLRRRSRACLDVGERVTEEEEVGVVVVAVGEERALKVLLAEGKPVLEEETSDVGGGGGCEGGDGGGG